MKRLRQPRTEDRPPTGARELLLYLVVGAAYIGLGVAYQEFLLSFFVGVGFLLLGVWILPAAYRRVRR